MSQGYNLDTDASCALHQPTDLPNVASTTLGLDAQLQDHGGPTLTLALLASSPAIDHIDTSVCPPPAQDQRGVQRPQPSGGRCDSGAFELESAHQGELFVDAQDGNDANACVAQDSPCKTIGGAVNKASAGDTIVVAAGSYTAEMLPITIDKNLTFQGAGAGSTTVDGKQTSSVFLISQGVAVQMHGLAIQNGKASQGGGMVNAGTLTLSRCVLSHNNATTAGGGIVNTGTLTLTASTLSNNQAGTNGGGIANTGTLQIDNSTLSANQAPHGNGGGLWHIAPDHTASVNNSTLNLNSASNGGGLWAAGSPLALYSSIVANSTGSNCAGALSSQGYNLDSDGTCKLTGPGDLSGTLQTAFDPQLGPLTSLDASTPVHVPGNDSPVLDAGNPQCPQPTPNPDEGTDQQGVTRPQNLRCDIGAVDVKAKDLGDVFVAPDGSDTADCFSQARPCASLTQAVANSKAGDTIVVAAGTYTVGTTVTFNKDLTVTGAEAGSTIFDGGGQVQVFHIAPGTTVTLHGLTVQNGTDNAGGGIHNEGTLTLSDCTVQKNATSADGGGVYNDKGTLTLLNCTVSSNTAGNNGGGIVNAAGTLSLTATTLSGNTATGFGGGIYNDGSASVTTSTLSGNSAGSGGSLWNGSTVEITNSTLSGNAATHEGGGGILNVAGGSVTLNNSTLNLNHASSSGGGVQVAAGSTLRLYSTIVANSMGGNCAGTVTSLGYNLDSDGSCQLSGTGNVSNQDPMLDATLKNNGGPTLTHALLDGSPAANAGAPDCPPPGTDQRGVQRPQDTRCTIGAVDMMVVPPLDRAKAFVNGASGSDTNNCYTLQTACRTLGAAVRQVQADGTITVAQAPQPYGENLTIAKNLTIQWDGSSPPIIDGGKQGTVLVINQGVTVTLDHLTIQNGHARAGGGIVNNGTLTLNATTVSDNQADDQGGGIFNTGTLTLINSGIRHNQAGAGGGIFSFGPLTIHAGDVQGNTAILDQGGGIVIDGAQATIVDKTIVYNNTAATDGGGIAVTGSGTLSFTQGQVSTNLANCDTTHTTPACHGRGGGIFNDVSSQVTLTQHAVVFNQAAQGGGVFSLGPLHVTNSTVSTNTAAQGGGIYLQQAQLTLSFSTIAANGPPPNAIIHQGSGIFNDAGTVQTASSIVANVTSATSNCQAFGAVHFTSEGYNLDSDGTCGLTGTDDKPKVDPGLGGLADNGGTTQTLTHALLTGSPALKGGGPSCPATDQRGFLRPAANCDSGAYQTQSGVGEPAPALLTLRRGKATEVGDQPASTSLTLAGTFPVASDLNLGTATVVLDALLAEGDLPGELVSSLPLRLTARRGARNTAVIYESAQGVQPKVRLELKNRHAGQRPLDITLRVENATIAVPQSCSSGQPSTTTLRTAFTIADGVNPPVTVAGETLWECVGTTSAMPRKLRLWTGN